MHTPRAVRLTAVFCTLALLLTGRGTAEDWSQFRGPTGGGVSVEKELPLTWGGTKHPLNP